MNYTLTQLLETLVLQKGSDLHLSVASPPRFRIDGKLHPINVDNLTSQDVGELCYSVLTEEQKKNLEVDNEIDFSFSVEGIGRFRANVFLQKETIAGVFRAVPLAIKSLEELGLPPVFRALASTPRGLVLVTGPTGSGKSTTLAAMVDFINRDRRDHIMTIEDPIEFLHSSKKCLVNQREVGKDTKSFQRALKSVLRQDPDVVLIGELRDLESTMQAVTVAETGHLVLGTLHTNSAVTSLNRLIDIFPSEQQPMIRTQLALNLSAVVSQLLIPSIKGGRALALEIMIPNIAIRSLIRENKIHQLYSAIQIGQEQTRMQTMNQSLLALWESNIISYEEALSKSSSPDELLGMMEESPQWQAKNTKG